jgi:hypothetical protein
MDKKISNAGIEWRRFLPLFKAILASNNIAVVDNKSQADEVVKVDYGLSTSGNVSRRHLHLASYRKDMEVWKMEIVSNGKLRDMKQVLPVLASAARARLAQPKEENIEVKVNENDLSVLSFKDYAESFK